MRVLVTLCASAMTSFLRWSWSLCLTQLAPAYSVTSICRFVQAATTLPIILMSLSRPHLPPLVSLVSPIFRCHLQSLHLLPASSVVILRPFALSFSSWRVLPHSFPQCDYFLRKERDSNPRCSQIYEAYALLHVLTFCFRPLSHPSEKSAYSHEPAD